MGTRTRLDDTIAAIATAPGEGALGIVRLSGPGTLEIAGLIFKARSGRSLADLPSHSVHYGNLVDVQTGAPIDEALATLLRAPRTFTREDMVEFSCHGGPWILQRVLASVLAAGARLAQPGEFTQRAFLNGRIDLAQAEAVLDLIRSRTDLASRAALDQLTGRLSQRLRALRADLVELAAQMEALVDFPDEDLETYTWDEARERMASVRGRIQTLLATAQKGQVLRQGLRVVLCGRPNAGKSSLLNALLGAHRAIVSDIPGTTRDVIEETANLGGVPVVLADTAGLIDTQDRLEREGVARARQRMESADLWLVCVDGSRPMTEEDRVILEQAWPRPSLAVLTKRDLPGVIAPRDLSPWAPAQRLSWVSSVTGLGLDELEQSIVGQVAGGTAVASDEPMITHVRHRDALVRADAALGRALETLSQRLSPEFITFELREALDAIGEVTGEVVTDEILDRIFSQFCVGK